VSHLVCNAGVAPFLRISWSLFLQQLWQDTCQLKPFEFASHPRFNIQRTGIMSDDGLGWAWQCNVFGHYIIVRSSSTPSPLHADVSFREQCRALEAQLAASRTRSGFGPARVVWMSSLESRADAYDAEDWQLVQSKRPYEGTKFQNDLVCAELARRAGPSPTAAVRHITVHPGVVYSLIDAAIVGSFSAKVKIIVFYLVRCFHALLRCFFGSEFADAFRRRGGSVRYTTISRHGTVHLLPSTSASRRLRLFRSFSLPQGHPQRRGRQNRRWKNRIRFRRDSILSPIAWGRMALLSRPYTRCLSTRRRGRFWWIGARGCISLS
jgi:NAD(P)-dependent dehydrogenase (short-subunit alcohol dehydrogenase family)